MPRGRGDSRVLLPRLSLDAVLWWSVKGSVITLLSLAATTLLQRRPAAVRHAVWTVAVLCQLVLPLTSALVPTRTLAVRVPARAFFTTTAPSSSAFIPGTRPAAPEPAPPIRTDSILELVAVAGTLLFLLRLAAGTLRVRSITREASRVIDGAWLAQLEQQCHGIHISRPVRLLLSERVTLPATWGFIRPAILLPAGAMDWPPALRRHVLLHELGHIRRRDALTQFASQLAIALFWFNPLVWMAVARMRFEAENACDDYVLRDGERPSIYASTLLGLARLRVQTSVPTFAALSMGRRSDLERRVRAITNPLRDSSAWRAGVAVVAGVMVILVLPLSAIQRAAWSEKPQAHSQVDAAAGRIACRPLLVPDAHFSETSGRLTLDGTTVHYFFLRPEPRRCIEASFSMDAAFTDDDLDLAVTPGLRALVREKREDMDRAVTITESGGRLLRAFTIDGHSAAWSASAEAWYQTMLPEFIRRTSAGAETRARRIVERDGVDGLIAEVSRMLDDGARSDYLLALSSLRTPDQLPRQQVIGWAADALRADEPALAHFYAELARREASLPRVRSAILTATENLKDPSDRNIVLEAMAIHSDPAVRIAALGAIDLLPDDVWRRLLLEDAAGSFLGPNPVLVDAYFAAEEKIEGAGDQRLLLTALLTRELPPAVRDRIATVAARISDAGERAAVQRQILM